MSVRVENLKKGKRRKRRKTLSSRSLALALCQSSAHLQVRAQARSIEGLLPFGLVEFLAKEDVVPEGGVGDPRPLRYERDAAAAADDGSIAVGIGRVRI